MILSFAVNNLVCEKSACHYPHPCRRHHVCWQEVLLGEHFSQRHEWEVFGEPFPTQWIWEPALLFWKGKSLRWMDGWCLRLELQLRRLWKHLNQHLVLLASKKVPCDSSIQSPDESEKLNSKDSKSYRSIIGPCGHVSRELPDLMFTIKELASNMAAPTLTSVQRLRKLVGYMKHVGDLALRLDVPIPGQGKCFSEEVQQGFWRFTLMQMGLQTKIIENQPHVECIIWTMRLALAATEAKEPYHFHPANQSCVALSMRCVIEFSLPHARNSFLGRLWNMFTTLTVLQHVRLHHVKVVDAWDMCQEN